MGKLRLLFAKEGRAVYISHLDLLRTFQRVFLRQGLVLRHSQGFHPHPILSFALPLPVGQSSVCELLDFEVTEELDGKDLPEKLNRFMPEGIRARDCYIPVWPVRELAEAAIQKTRDFFIQHQNRGQPHPGIPPHHRRRHGGKRNHRRTRGGLHPDHHQ